MIFVTVGTHEDPFDRLIREVDCLKGQDMFPDEVLIQSGYAKYTSQHCRQTALLGVQEMDRMVRDARIVITHGGPSSIMHPLRYGKIPIVVPRQKKFKEHVDDHQLLFCEKFSAGGKILPVYDIDDLKDTILNYPQLTKAMQNKKGPGGEKSLSEFVEKLAQISLELAEGKRPWLVRLFGRKPL